MNPFDFPFEIFGAPISRQHRPAGDSAARQAVFSSLFQQAAQAYQSPSALQSQAYAQRQTAGLGPLLASMYEGMGQAAVRPLTEREIAIAELKEALGDDLWDLAPLNP